MAEKKQNIQDGKNIELDGITVINEGISLAEKEEVKDTAAEEAPAAEAEVEITPDVKIVADEEAPAAEETPVVEAEAAPEPDPVNIPAPIAIDIDPVAVDPEPVVAPAPEVAPIVSEETPVQDEVSAYDVGTPSENPFSLGGYNENVVDNRPQVPSVPDNVLNAFEVARNEVSEIYMENQSLKREVEDYKNAIAEKDQEILDKDKQINELSTALANYRDKLSLVRNKVLDEFGLGGMAVEQTPVAGPTPASFADANQGIQIDNSTSLAA